MNPNVTSLSDVSELFAGDQTSRRWARAMVRSAHHHQRLPIFVVCAQAPGRIDGVLVLLVVEVLITTHSACLLMRAELKELGQLACRNAASTASSSAGKKPRGVLYGPLVGQ